MNKKTNYIKNIFYNNFYAISLYLRQIAGTLVLFLIARYLTVYDFGLFSSYKNIAAFALMFANMGYNEYILVSSKARILEVRLKISIFMLNAIIIAILCMVGSLFFSIEAHLLFILVIARTFLDGTFFALVLPYFQASKKFNILSAINILYSLGVMLIAICSYIFKLSLLKFLILSVLLGIVNFIQCSFYAKINYFLVCKKLTTYLQQLDKSIFSYIGVIVAFYLYSQIPSLYVSTKLSKEDAALYFAAFTIASVINLFITALNQKILPELINNTSTKIRKILKKNFLLLFIVNIVIFLFFVFTGKFLLKLFYGQEYYRNAYVPLLLLTLTNIWLAMANIYGAYITATGRQKYKIPHQTIAILLSVLILFIFNNCGIYSACLACFISSLYVAIMYTKQTFKFLKQQEQQENIKENLCSSKI